MNKYVKFPLVLGTVALLSGALLATTYQLTKEKIEQGVIDRQTSAINDLFKIIDSKELIDVPSEYASKGVKTIVKVTSEGQEYNCYTITFKDSVGGDEGSVIVALDSNAKVYGFKFVSTGDSYMAKYNDDTYLANVVKNDKFDTISGATLTGNDLNNVIKIAKDCMSGKQKEPIDELFDNNISTRITINKPSNANSKINSIQKVTSLNKTYYVYDITFKDTFGGDSINVLYALNSDGSFYRVKVVTGDGYAGSFDLINSLDSVTGATYTQTDLKNYYEIIKECHDTLLLNEIFTEGITSKQTLDKTGANTKIKNILKIISGGNIYYVYEVLFNDTFGNDKTRVLYALNEDSNLYKVNIILGDNYANSFDLKNEFDSVSGATYTKTNLKNYYDIVKAFNDTLVEGE